MTKSISKTALLFAQLFLALQIAGAIFPTVFTWGFHFLGFVPSYILIMYCCVVVALLYYARQPHCYNLIARLADIMAKRPVPFLFVTIFIFAVVAFLLRIRVPLLGDSFIAINIYRNTFTGVHPLPASHQPFSLYFFYYIMIWLKVYEYPEIMNAFLIGELVLGAGFIVCAFYTIRNIVENPIVQCCSFLFALVLPYMQIFFGYVELYSVVLFALSLYALSAVLYLKGKISFHWLPSAYVLLLLTHYLNLLLLPSLLYIGYLEVQKNKYRDILGGIGIVSGCAFAALILMQFNIEAFIPPHRPTPILSFIPSDDAYQAYTMFSPYHIVDLLNLFILLCSGSMFFIGLTWKFGRNYLATSHIARWFIVAAVPMLMFFIGAKFDLPLAQDWDVSSSYMYIVALFAVYVSSQWLLQKGEENVSDGVSAVVIVVVATACYSLTWFGVNSSTDPNIDRIKMFIDNRISSHDGCFQSTLHLSEYYLHAGDIQHITEVSEQFTRMYPSDPRGYSNYILYLMETGQVLNNRLDELFRQWFDLDSTDLKARMQFANFQLQKGQELYLRNNPTKSIQCLRTAIAVNPKLVEAYNSLGVVYKNNGQPDSAIGLYAQAIAIDSNNVNAYINMGNAFDEAGNSTRAIECYKKAIVIAPTASTAYYNLGVTYYKIHALKDADDVLQLAARMGNPEAQAFLQKHAGQ